MGKVYLNHPSLEQVVLALIGNGSVETEFVTNIYCFLDLSLFYHNHHTQFQLLVAQ